MFQLSHLMPWNWVWASTLSCKKLFWPTSIMTYSLLLHQKDQHRTSICCFLVWSSMFVLLCSFTKKKTGSVFPAFCHATFHHPLITCCNVSRVGYNCSNVSRWGYIWFYARSCDQESANDSPCIVEWKSRNITNDDIIGRYLTIIPQARMGSDSEAIKARGITVSVKSS